MRILILTFFFPPDLSAGSFRMGALITRLLPRLPPGAKVDIITTKPNRYASFDIDSREREEQGSLTIERISLPPHQSGMVDQARAFLSFDREVNKRIKDRHYDLVFATSSKLMTAFLGARIAVKKKTPLFLDIRDIFADTVKDVFPGWKGRLILPFLNWIERYSFRKASRLNLVSEGFKDYFNDRYPNLTTQFLTNGIDDDFINENWKNEKTRNIGPIRVLYAGNIGEGQGLHKILPQLAKLAGVGFKFIVIGDGGRKSQLKMAIDSSACSNVELLPPVNRANLIRHYKECDVLFLHLNDYEAFAKVLPSKLFEYAATGKPILAGVGGYAAGFLRSQVENCEIFTPCDAEAGLKALEGLVLEYSPRCEFINKFDRRKIMDEMADSIINLGINGCKKRTSDSLSQVPLGSSEHHEH